MTLRLDWPSRRWEQHARHGPGRHAAENRSSFTRTRARVRNAGEGDRDRVRRVGGSYADWNPTADLFAGGRSGVHLSTGRPIEVFPSGDRCRRLTLDAVGRGAARCRGSRCEVEDAMPNPTEGVVGSGTRLASADRRSRRLTALSIRRSGSSNNRPLGRFRLDYRPFCDGWGERGERSRNLPGQHFARFRRP